MVLRSKHICGFSDHIKEILPQQERAPGLPVPVCGAAGELTVILL